MTKLSVTATGILAGSAALFLLGLAWEKAKARRSPAGPGGGSDTLPTATTGAPENAEAQAREAWPFPTSEGQKLP